MNLFEDTNPRALKELLAEVHSHAMALPDFQRDFVWEPGATQELIVSIASNYPAGSILRVRDARHFFAARAFEGAASLTAQNHTFLVLDGQQRLTSLYQAFYGVGDHRYYLNLKKLLDGSEFEEAIFHVRSATKWITAIDKYHFPVVTLSNKTEPDALCTIFETLNRTGIKLTVFELLTARFWPQNIKLRELWETALDTNEIIKIFDVDPYYVLQAIALASRRTPSCKRSDVLNLAPSDIERWWQPVITGLVRGLTILRDDCKVMLPKWLPYQTMLAPLAAILAKAGVQTTPEAGAQREMIKRWFWCALFGQAYESSPNSQSARDVAEVVAWFTEGPLPESVTALRFDPKALRDVSPRQRSLYRGTICLILGSGTRDFHTQAVITGNLMTEQGIDDHRVFPDDYEGFLTWRQEKLWQEIRRVTGLVSAADLESEEAL